MLIIMSSETKHPYYIGEIDRYLDVNIISSERYDLLEPNHNFLHRTYVEDCIKMPSDPEKFNKYVEKLTRKYTTHNVKELFEEGYIIPEQSQERSEEGYDNYILSKKAIELIEFEIF